ncbi:MAG: LysR family transcriptional regulator [Pseudomonadales bacterium]
MLVQFRGLRAFCVAAQRLSFKQAADELCLTASAVSHQIRDLEDHLGVKLFERRTRAVVLTDDGRALFRDVHPHLSAIEQATRRSDARYASLGVGALEQATLLLHQSRSDAWHRWAELARLRPPLPRQIIRLDSMVALARAAERGAGIALIPMPISQLWFQSGALLRLFRQDLESPDSYYALAGGGAEGDAAETLLRWIISTFAEPLASSAAA